MKNQTVNLSKQESRPLIVGASGLARHWRHLSPGGESAASITAVMELLQMECATRQLQPLLWEALDHTPPQLSKTLSRLPKELPLLLRYERPLAGAVSQSLRKLLQRRRQSTLLSRPLRFWPPACRVGEIAASGVLGRITSIKAVVGTDDREGLPLDQWRVSSFDLLELATSLLGGAPPLITHRSLVDDGWRLVTDFAERRTLEVKHIPWPANDADTTTTGLRMLAVVGQHGELRLQPAAPRPGQPSASGLQWSLQRLFAKSLTTYPLQPLTIADIDPVSLELKWFFSESVKPWMAMLTNRSEARTNTD